MLSMSRVLSLPRGGLSPTSLSSSRAETYARKSEFFCIVTLVGPLQLLSVFRRARTYLSMADGVILPCLRFGAPFSCSPSISAAVPDWMSLHASTSRLIVEVLISGRVDVVAAALMRERMISEDLGVFTADHSLPISSLCAALLRRNSSCGFGNDA